MRLRAERSLGLVAALALLLAAACASPRHIRDAQSAFNDASRAENADRVAALKSSGFLLSGESAAAGYRVAVGLVGRELTEHEADLHEDGLLGTALMLRALCLWRIAALDADAGAERQLDEAIADLQGRIADPNSGIALGPRDDALLAALPGLRDHDVGLRQTDYGNAKRYFESAITVYDGVLARPNLPPGHPFRTYLLLSKLATLRAWKDAAFEDGLDRTQRDAVERNLIERGKDVAAQLAPATQQDTPLAKLVQECAKAIGFSWPT